MINHKQNIKEIIKISKSFNKYMINNYPLSSLNWWPTKGLLFDIQNKLNIQRFIPMYDGSLFTIQNNYLRSIILPNHIFNVKDINQYDFINKSNGKYQISKNFFGNNIFYISGQELINIIDSHNIVVISPMTKKFYINFQQFLSYDLKNKLELPCNDFDVLTLNDLLNGDFPYIKKLLTDIANNPKAYDLNLDSLIELFRIKRDKNNKPVFTRTLYELGCMVIHSVISPLMVDSNYQIKKRNVGDNDHITQIDITGLRGYKSHVKLRLNENLSSTEINNEYLKLLANNYLGLFKEIIRNINNELNILCLPAIGMGVWQGNPDIYWGALNLALEKIPNGFLNKIFIIINPNGKTNSTEWNKLVNHPQIITTMDKDLISIVCEFKKKYNNYKIYLANASDPDRTLLANLTGQYSNNKYNYVDVDLNGKITFEGKFHPSTTEEHFAKLNPGVYLSSENITNTIKLHPERIHQA